MFRKLALFSNNYCQKAMGILLVVIIKGMFINKLLDSLVNMNFKMIGGA